ncbi:lplA [Symbiodinium necroappetens]|uniref:LplA protein n=1 Tax=Symbiodinium necroappetens TaxID=1628268 RepID=A0A812TAU4_9DINO|nr:lplA [Symbiodinium necroappetens]
MNAEKLTAPLMYLWRPQPVVTIGRHQNPWKECVLSQLDEDGVALVRRRSGGGAIFQDAGCSVFTFLFPSGEFDIDRNLETVLGALGRLGVQAEKKGRNDLTFEDKKISGSAFKHAPDRGVSLHHGTVLVDTDLTALQRYLTPDKRKLQAKGIASVGARVMNLKEKFPEAIGTRSIRHAVDAPSCLGFVRGTMNVIVIAKTVPPQLFWCGEGAQDAEIEEIDENSEMAQDLIFLHVRGELQNKELPGLQAQPPHDLFASATEDEAMAAVCPICFEDDRRPVEYATMHNHSWHNQHCDAHGICWKCLNRFVEVQILEEGRFNIKCPGIGCNYRLLPLDVERALELSEPECQQVALERYSSMRSASHGQRLREVVLETAGPSERWLLEECQACPQCLSLVRREDGCLHVFCRCGCDFCAGCGSPKGCLCSQLEKDREIVFAAWLRISPDSPAAWLRDLRCDRQEEHLLTTLGFFLWMAYLPVDLPWTRALEEPEHSLPPVRWRSKHSDYRAGSSEDWAFDLEPGHVFRYPLGSWCNLVDGDEEENCFQHYRRAPRRPWRPFATQRSSRRQDRHHYTPLCWKDVRPWTGDDAAAPLRRRRQPRAVATGARSAEHAAAAARKVCAQRRRRQEMHRRFREQLVQLD